MAVFPSNLVKGKRLLQFGYMFLALGAAMVNSSNPLMSFIGVWMLIFYHDIITANRIDS